MVYVYDTSFVGAVIIPDEKNQRIDKLQKTVGEEEDIFVPQLFWYEIASVFNKLIRYERYTFDEVMQFFPYITEIRLTTDFETGDVYSQKLLRLSSHYRLSAYDAAYLELAERKKAVLCTLDKNLTAAAKNHGVKILA